ncbi:hypothetical protein [Agromyces atrinae]|uniref:WxL domain-containing protein n=1 Tax=Agromyces atrinae TaxID=592376 RepID=A0A4Q2M615_9MICO|nr:hypothetical protein [Agromyces atrinae]NYD68276.1 hypothetical protein [Agromyces atrinae]RXZ85663.1 hypothetical protein ESP50_14340 [Agromyces atrinae]
MKTKELLARTALGALGGAMLVGMAGVAVAAELEADDVAVNVTIDPVAPVGALTMTVDAASTTLTEAESDDAAYRVFAGALPTVTVSDDRAEVPASVYWYVTGQSSAFTSGSTSDTIGADRLGWTPALITPGNGEVAEGDPTVPSVDEATQGAGTPGANNVGLAGEELLALALDSADARPTGSWSANAALTLKADADVSPGAYAATITLTLWEDEQ